MLQLSIYNKKNEKSTFPIESDIDIVLGCEAHLPPSINIAKILLAMYYSYTRDRADGCGGVIIIAKKSLTVEEIKISRERGMMVIVVGAYRGPVIFAFCCRPPRGIVGELLFGGWGG